MPSLPQFRGVLDELGVRYDVEELPPDPARGFDSEEEAREMIARRLYVSPGAPAAERLQSVLDDSLECGDGGTWRITGSSPLQACIVSWTPG